MSAAGYPLSPDPGVEWTGAKRRYDIVKEAVIAILAVSLLAILLSLLFSSPDDKPVTISQWAVEAPQDFLATAATELAGTSGLATYGPPYNHAAGAGQNVLDGVSLQRIVGVHIPIDPAKAFVLDPLAIPVANDPTLAAALTRYEHAPRAQQQRWATGFANSLAKSQSSSGSAVRGGFGPVPELMGGLLGMARSGALDAALISTNRFYQTNFTKSLLFLADGSYLESVASSQNLLGSQWGMMNETGNYPGQAWLWLYTLWYQIKPFSTSDNADAQIWAIMAILSLALVCIPFIPGVRSIPRWVPIYRLIWRDYYRHARSTSSESQPKPTAASP